MDVAGGNAGGAPSGAVVLFSLQPTRAAAATRLRAVRLRRIIGISSVLAIGAITLVIGRYVEPVHPGVAGRPRSGFR